MDFAQAITDVIVRTKRSDKVDVIGQSINKAITDFCRMKKFSKDLAYVEWSVPAADQGAILLHIPWAEFTYDVREFELIRGINDSCGLERIASNQTLLRGRVRNGTYYESAAGVHLALRVPTDVVVLSYYHLPPRLSVGTETNWVLNTAYDEILERAAAITFRTIGEDREADRLMNMSMLSYERASRDIV